MNLPPYIPSMLVLSGEWDLTLDLLFGVFKRDFIDAPPYYCSMRVIHDSRPSDGGLPNGFWHIVTKTVNDERLLDFRRAERLPWARPVIENCHSTEIRVWDYEESRNRVRAYIWLEALDYVVIIEKKRSVAFLVTAYHVDGESTRRSLRRKYSQRL